MLYVKNCFDNLISGVDLSFLVSEDVPNLYFFKSRNDKFKDARFDTKHCYIVLIKMIPVITIYQTIRII